MRRALLAATATVVGLVALLDYKSSGRTGLHPMVLPASPSTPTPPSTPPTTPSPVRQPPTTLAPQAAASPPTTTGPARYVGEAVEYRYGEIEVAITVGGGRITAVSVPLESAPDGHSERINQAAIPVLESEAISAQSASIDAVSGATYTSEAFDRSLQSALLRAGR